MIDIHNHLLYDVDDGARSIDESILLLKNLGIAGITDVILTPHYVMGSIYTYDNNEKEERLLLIREEAKRKDINVNLYLGNEVMLDDDIIEDIADGKISTLNNSKYILIEFSYYENYGEYNNQLKTLLTHHYIPILAHPERYSYLYEDFDFYKSIINMGVLLQGNLGSLTGHNGKKAKYMIEELLKRDMIHFMATDIHNQNDIEDIDYSKAILKNLVGTERYEELLNINPGKIMETKHETIE